MKTYILASVAGLLGRLKKQKGQTLVEYSLILVLCVIILFGVLFAMSDSLKIIFGKVTQTLSVASGS